MKKIIVPRESCRIRERQYHLISHRNWEPSGPDKAPPVEASFDISHRGTAILLTYQVREGQIRAVNTEYNSPVYLDSCVEFFISLDEDPGYYNFEFNAIGTVLGSYGPGRHNRDSHTRESLEQISTTPSLGTGIIKNLEGDISWKLEVVLPVSVFSHHRVTDISGMKATANFYKCGDKLDHPHYLSWEPVRTKTPDFHQPRFFGELIFT